MSLVSPFGQFVSRPAGSSSLSNGAQSAKQMAPKRSQKDEDSPESSELSEGEEFTN